MNFGQITKKHSFRLMLLTLLSVAGVVFITTEQVIAQNPRILPNVYIAHIDVGGLLPDEAEQKIKKSIADVMTEPLLITDQQNVWLIQPSEVDLSIDVKQNVAAAYAVGRESNLFQRWRQRLVTKDQVYYLPINVELNRSKLAKALAALSVQTDRQPRDASLQVMPDNKTVSLIPAVKGRKLNVEQSVAQALHISQKHTAFVVELVFDVQPPKVTDEQYAGINTVLSTYSTYFKPWDEDRNANLRLATGRIHGSVLKAGETFSYNQNVGHRTQQEGFRMAPVILDGKLVPDWGGGVCQVSSTLYNAALLADLEIVDRSNHGRAIGYVPLGFDATVVDGQIDFKFKNNLKNPILIHSLVTDNELIFSILGDKKDLPPPIELEYIVHKVIEPVEVKQPDPTLEIGKEVMEESPQRGFKVSTYRIRTINGKQVTQLLFTDDYDPVNRIIKVGAKPANSPSATATGLKKTPEMPPKGKPVSGTITLHDKPVQSSSLPSTSTSR